MQKLIKLYSFLKENHIKEAELLKKALVSNAHFIITPDNNIFLITKDPETGKNIRVGNLWLENKGKVVGNLNDFKYGKNMGYRPGLMQYAFYSNDLIRKDIYAPHIEIEEEFKNMGLGSALYKTALWHCKNKLKFSHMISLGLSSYEAFISKINSNQINVEFLDLQFEKDNKALLKKSDKSKEENIKQLENIYESRDPKGEFYSIKTKPAVLHKQIENSNPVYPVYYVNYEEGYSPSHLGRGTGPDLKNIKNLEMKHPELTEEELDSMNKEDYQFGFEDNYSESFSTPYD
jgi:predicted nucleic acid-binding protein